jgi:ribose transport system permease protein
MPQEQAHMVRLKIALPPALRAPAKRGIRYVMRLSNGGLLLTLLALVVLFSLLSRHFASPSNMLLILMQMTPLAVVVAGQTLVIITGGIDMSVGSLAGLTSVIAAMLMTAETGLRLPPLLAIAVALLVATLIGWGHGWLITRAGLSPFVVTFGSYSLIRGLALVYSNASPIPIPHSSFNWMSTLVGTILPIPIVVMVLVFLGMSRILSSTKLGRYAYAIGGNETVARLSGVNVNRYKAQVYAISGFLAGLSGILLMTRIESGAYTSGEDYALNSIAAVIIGGASLRGGSGSIWGSFLGVLLLTVVSATVAMLIFHSVESQSSAPSLADTAATPPLPQYI